MLYEVSCTSGNELTAYICRDSSEVANAVFDCGGKLDIPHSLLMFSVIAVGPHIASEDTEPFDFMGIKCRNLSEEEYEKWQKAF